MIANPPERLADLRYLLRLADLRYLLRLADLRYILRLTGLLYLLRLADLHSQLRLKRPQTGAFKSSSYSSDDGDAARSPDTATDSEHRYWSPSAALPQPI